MLVVVSKKVGILGPLKSHIILGTRRTRRGAINKVILTGGTGSGPAANAIMTINRNHCLSGNRGITPTIGRNSHILFSGCTNGRIRCGNRGCLIIHRGSLITVISWMSLFSRSVGVGRIGVWGNGEGWIF